MEKAELEGYYDAHAEDLFRYFLAFTRSEADARDLLQDLFVKLARNAGCLEGVKSERAFLLRMARNLAVDRLRRGQVRRRREGECARGKGPGTMFTRAGDPDEAQFRAGLEEALRDLPEEQRGVVFLKLWQGLTFEEVAAVEGISPNTAASRYRYGIDKLRARLRPLYEEIR